MHLSLPCGPLCPLLEGQIFCCSMLPWPLMSRKPLPHASVRARVLQHLAASHAHQTGNRRFPQVSPGSCRRSDQPLA